MYRVHHSPCYGLRKSWAGFTLIELMVVITILAILASIAVPSYRSTVMRNAEHEAMTRSLAIANELSSWRSKKLSYSGFIPRNEGCGSLDYCYSDNSRGVIYVPLGSSEATHNYAITIVDAQATLLQNGGNSGRVPLNASSNVSGKGWRMLVEPNTAKPILAKAHSYYLDSIGQRCQYSSGAELPSLTEDRITCDGAGVGTW